MLTTPPRPPRPAFGPARLLLRASLLLVAALLPSFSPAQEKTLGIGPVDIAPALLLDASESTQTSLRRVAEALDGQFLSALQDTRKFQLVARRDLPALRRDGGLPDPEVSGSPAVDYLLVPSIDDFQDITEKMNFPALGRSAERRTLRLGLLAKIYEARTGRLLEAANLQIEQHDAHHTTAALQSAGGSPLDALLRRLAESGARVTTARVLDVIHPARIVARTGNIVTINRGDGTGIAPDQTWQVFALGAELVDPDTGASLGREESPVGRVRIQRVTPRSAQAEIVEEGQGLDRGALVRRAAD
jgi:hypothetical protein